jgi:hypothetical protein
MTLTVKPLYKTAPTAEHYPILYAHLALIDAIRDDRVYEQNPPEQELITSLDGSQ